MDKETSYEPLAKASSPPKTRLRVVIVGNTNVCNALCLHCPTGKAED